MVNVPKIPELSVTNLLADVVRDAKLKQYLPDLTDSEGRIKTISRQFLFNIINSLKPEFFPQNITGLMKSRKEDQAEKNKTFIEVKSHIYDLIMNS
jgi:hypothetical protein